MPFIPHTEEDVRAMLSAIGAESVEQLFDEIPDSLRGASLATIPEGMSEMLVTRHMRELAARDKPLACFMGAGAYEHHIPAFVWELTTRGEFYSAYTPYQAEASQGTLQLLYEYQTMMASLTGMDVSNASLYDGATALAEAVLMAIRANRKNKSTRVLVPANVHPLYRRVTHAVVHNQGIELVEVPVDAQTGCIDEAQLDGLVGEGIAAMVVPYPNFFGGLEAVDKLTDWAHAQDAMVIAVANPTALALLKAPGQWGETGADICCGEGQPLGIPMASGGPYFGFITCKQAIVRQMPGRIIGRTVDLEGRQGFTLTLQAREQHIRRSKATSNICTNQGLMVTAATMYMSALGAEGLRRVAAQSLANTRKLARLLTGIPGVHRLFDGPHFHEVALGLDKPVAPVLKHLQGAGYLGGYPLNEDFPDLGESLLVCATETKTDADLQAFAEAFAQAMREG